MKNRRGRLTKRDEIKAMNASHRYVALFSPRPDAQALAESLCRPVPKERAAPKPSGERLERDILKDIIKALRRHPKVATVERKQSAVFMDGDRHIRLGRRGDPDIGGMLKGGRTYSIEVKRPGERPSEIQARRLQDISAAGGLSGCAHSVEEAIAIIEGADERAC